MTATKITKKAQAELDRTAALDELRELMPVDGTVYTIIRHVSSSGMSRVIAPLVFVNGQPRYLSRLMSDAGLFPVTRDPNHDGLRVQGCGMDMCFHVVYTLASALYGDGYRLTCRNL